jgi:hypothetical protein
MFKLGREPTDTQSLLEESWRLYRSTLSFSLLYSFIVSCLITLPFLFMRDIHNIDLLFIVTLVVASLLGFIITNALLFRVYCYCSQVPSNVFFSLKQVFVKLPGLIFIMFAYVMIVLSGAVLFIIPGLIFAFSLMFSFILVLTDNKAILQNLMASHQLVWPHWRHAFFTIVTPLLFNIVVSMIFFIIISEWGLSFKIPKQTIVILLAITNIIIQTLFIPYIIDVTVVLLNDLRLRKTLTTPPWN